MGIASRYVGLCVDPRVNVTPPKVPRSQSLGHMAARRTLKRSKVGWGISSDGSVSTDTVDPTLMGTM